MFRAAYESAARKIDRSLVGTAPSRAQHHRWTSGALKRLPYTDHCRVLETMFPGWTADQLFAPCPDVLPADPPADGAGAARMDVDVAGPVAGAAVARPMAPPGVASSPPPALAAHAPSASSTSTGAPSVPAEGFRRGDPAAPPGGARLADVAAVFATRAEFTYAMPPHALFGEAGSIRAAGLSLNLLCQQYPDQHLSRLLERGARMQCLFLDPDGTAIKAREDEEGYTDRYLTTLTKLNIEVLSRLRDRLPAELTERISLAVYDETIRFGIVLIDDDKCVVQPYLPRARGLDSPTLFLERGAGGVGLYETFHQVYSEMWQRSRPV